MKNLTIRAKITLWFILILAVVLGLTYAVFYYSSQAGSRQIIQMDLQETVENDLDEVRFYPSGEEPGRIEGNEYVEYLGGWLEFEDDFLQLADGIGVGLVDGNRELIFGDDLIPRESGKIALTEGEIHTVRSGPDVFYVYESRLDLEGAGELWLRGAVDRDQHREEVSGLFHISLLLLPLLIIVAALCGYLITKRSLRPIRQLIDASEHISAGRDLKQRIDIGESEKNEVQQLARSFNGMMQRLDGSFEAEKQFTSDVSHELRTPVATILAQCELALEEDHLTEEEARDAILVIQRQGSRMEDMIEDMLTVGRIGRQQEKYPFELLDLSGLVRETCQEFRVSHPEQFRMETEIAGGITLKGSGQLLRRALSNLLENALRYGGESPEIRVRLYREDRQTLLEVSDDGIGIAPEHQERIFDRFYQADPARSSGGSGLGLAIVREIAQTHGGRISVSSAPGEGSTFTLILAD
ncbi:MAG: HAMP domain-containing protein [Firmicutes bacterium]|nr:HAMP domain-containing protein [Bacillota bacterium]